LASLEQAVMTIAVKISVTMRGKVLDVFMWRRF
jgi:hypothetical protein